jgi:hypothetical protein
MPFVEPFSDDAPALAGVDPYSYPWVKGDHIAVLIRVAGDPMSMITADALLIDPEKGARETP